MEWRKAVVAATVAGVALSVTGVATPPAPTAAASTGLAGSGPGEGRRHPGRAEEPGTPGETDPAPSAPVPVHIEEPQGQDQGPAAVQAPTGRVLQVLPLGAGLVLIGLGLGFLALRLRRGR
jgi:hypothetical protein